MLCLLLLVVVGLTTGLRSPAHAPTWAAEEESFVDKLNVERAHAGLAPLRIDVQLTRVARGWAGRMAATDRLEHNPRLTAQVRGPWTSIGENIGYADDSGGTPEDTVRRLHRAFMRSDGHRRNVLGDYSAVGVGVRVTRRGRMWVAVDLMQAPAPAGDASAGIVAAVRRSRAHFADPLGGGARARYVAVAPPAARAALGGAPGRAGPVLLTPGPTDIEPDPVLHPRSRAEIDRLLDGRGVVYLLGDSRSVSEAVARELRAGGYDVRRVTSVRPALPHLLDHLARSALR